MRGFGFDGFGFETTNVLRTLVLLFACVGCSPLAVQADDGFDSTSAPVAGMKVYIDPETGERTSPPRASAISRDAQLSGTTVAGEELIEEVNPAGGYTIDLKRRFGASSHARSVNGAVEVECESGKMGDSISGKAALK